MGYAEKRGDYWRGRYKIERGKYGTISDDDGETIRFRTKREAERAANDEEAKVRAGRRRDPAESRTTFGQYVSRWYAAQDLAASTLQNYKRHIEEHLLPAFEHAVIADITATDVGTWEKEERALGYAESSIKTWRATLHLILADAVDEGLRDANPATRRRGRGKRAGRSRNRGPEKAVTNSLGILLLAERAALLSGRDDEFAAVVLKGYTGMRWGELVGLETQYVRSSGLRVEWQQYELDTGEFHRCPPKDDSHRTLDLPAWLFGLVSEHIARTQPKPCPCHGLKYVFRGYRSANGAPQRPGPKLADVARRAGVSIGTASTVLNHPEKVPETTRAKVEIAAEELGYMRGGGSSGELAAHWRRNSFTTWLFRPAATGWYAKKAPQDARPVPVLADPWPGVPVRGRNATGRADSCWLPIAPRLTPHGLRHTHKTVMVELGTPPKLMDERMGHEDGSVQARYSHVTPEMRQRLVTALTGQWDASLAARREMAPGSPVAALDRLLKARV
ncbi:LacI family DNA-binding transcriptional regulator [Micromonospora sp. WMMA1363]|uniref:LacI family DNA-binding transcriptional regulator n=1 Tax=Micromonospora sp. WMMA1363 TaxID=3053985 RepID=UPI00259D2232|nr:LacI family DNA-binding transcriptional regulator [Micromonospora sp. WMMA1363]MDM4721341.1 LacI family DNA-binding transcriptional regulator [Micromonospora sp. WMMA1363]